MVKTAGFDHGKGRKRRIGHGKALLHGTRAVVNSCFTSGTVVKTAGFDRGNGVMQKARAVVNSTGFDHGNEVVKQTHVPIRILLFPPTPVLVSSPTKAKEAKKTPLKAPKRYDDTQLCIEHRKLLEDAADVGAGGLTGQRQRQWLLAPR